MYKINTAPIHTDDVPRRQRVFAADSLGRRIEWWDGFRSRTAAEIYWRMLARKGITAWIPGRTKSEIEWASNAEFIGQPEPESMVSRISACELQYDAHAEAEAQTNGDMAMYGPWTQLARSAVRRTSTGDQKHDSDGSSPAAREHPMFKPWVHAHGGAPGAPVHRQE